VPVFELSFGATLTEDCDLYQQNLYVGSVVKRTSADGKEVCNICNVFSEIGLCRNVNSERANGSVC
jgi:hypothetical protein